MVAEKEREQLGPFVITTGKNIGPNYIICAMCGKRLDKCNPESETDSRVEPFTPLLNDLDRNGAVAVPNFGWFCSQACGDAYESQFGVRFQRNATGKISYYEDE